MKSIIAILALLSAPMVFGQASTDKVREVRRNTSDTREPNKGERELRGDKVFLIYNYEGAIKYYTESDSLTIGGLRNLAEAYQKTNDFKSAMETYKRIVERKNCKSEDYYNYANSLRMNELYSEAEYWMDEYQKKSPNDIRAKVHEDYDMTTYRKLLDDQGVFKVANLGINSEYQEFGPSLYGQLLIYSAQAPRRGIILRKYAGGNEFFLDLYAVDTLNTGEYSREEFEAKFNRKYHEGTLTFSKDMREVFFTSNNIKEQGEDGKHNLQIFHSVLDSNMQWTKPVKLEFNSIEYSYGHPSLTEDGKRLYFSSDKPGGNGGTDIYYVDRDENGVWGEPENMGDEINTEGDEMYPFYNEENQIFFFSSDGHFGLGGLDVYACKIRGEKLGKVNNLGVPVNSAQDDFGVVFRENMKTGYISSNRAEGNGGDDIYKVTLKKPLVLEEYPKEIKGTAKDHRNKIVANATITLYDKDMNVVNSFTTDSTGAYSFTVEAFTEFTVHGSKKKHYNDSLLVATDFDEESKMVNLVLRYDEIKTIETIDHQLILDVETIYFDLNSAALRPDTKEKLDHVVQFMNDYPDIRIELGSHTDCRGNNAFNQRLSEARARNSAAYIKERITNPDRVTGRGYGEERPVTDCDCVRGKKKPCTKEEHQMNRRTEFTIVNR